MDDLTKFFQASLDRTSNALDILDMKAGVAIIAGAIMNFIMVNKIDCALAYLGIVTAIIAMIPQRVEIVPTLEWVFWKRIYAQDKDIDKISGESDSAIKANRRNMRRKAVLVTWSYFFLLISAIVEMGLTIYGA